MKGIPRTTRRNLLKQGTVMVAAVFGGVFGGMFTGRGGNAGAAPKEQPGPPSQTKLTLYGCHWHRCSQNLKRGEPLARGDQIATYGELLDRANGTKVGEFYSTGVHLRVPFGASPLAAASMEVHSFNLEDGTILGMGTSRMASAGGEDIYAVVAGTGRYAGARGSYTARQYPLERGGDGTAEFVFDLIS
ncbi:MAG: hypothetical protein V3U26_08380 [Dehalococcoidia bacterium]